MTAVTRYGERIGQAAAASFRCAECGEMAGVVKVARAGSVVDMGPPLGGQTYDRDAVVVDYFLGTSSKFADAEKLSAVQDALSASAPDPVVLRQIDWEFAPFHCPDCGLNYCSADWHTSVMLDDGFYDCTMGRCPRQHSHMVDDLPAGAVPRAPRVSGGPAARPRAMIVSLYSELLYRPRRLTCPRCAAVRDWSARSAEGGQQVV